METSWFPCKGMRHFRIKRNSGVCVTERSIVTALSERCKCQPESLGAIARGERGFGEAAHFARTGRTVRRISARGIGVGDTRARIAVVPRAADCGARPSAGIERALSWLRRWHDEFRAPGHIT